MSEFYVVTDGFPEFFVCATTSRCDFNLKNNSDNFEEIFTFQSDATTIGTRKSLPGIHDYKMRALHDDQRLGIAVAAIILLLLATSANIASFVVNFKR